MAKGSKKGGTYWLYGRHAVEAALGNPHRQLRAIGYSSRQLPDWLAGAPKALLRPMEPQQLEKLAPRDAVHQGVVAEVDPLGQPHLEEILPEKKPLLLLDQVTDPHNIGAILRSVAAFGIGAVILPKDGAPGESAVMAKAACGALERVAMISVTNLAQAMAAMKEAGYWIVGLDGQARDGIEKLSEYSPLALVLGAEGAGMRRLTREGCDLLVKIPMSGDMESLNVSNAAAISCYLIQQKG